MRRIWLLPSIVSFILTTTHYQLGVIDRVEEEEYAVVLVEEEALEYIVPITLLPVGSKTGEWLFIFNCQEQLCFRRHIQKTVAKQIEVSILYYQLLKHQQNK